MRCARCGTELIQSKRFCHACGEPIARSCPSCGSPVEEHFRFCPDCGEDLPEGSDTSAVGDGASPDSRAASGENLQALLTRGMPDSLATKLRQSDADSGERKRVTVLFCDLVGSTSIAENLDPEIYRELLDEYLELSFAEIFRLEGTVNQLAGDGMMALFGAPIPHEDAPERALRAALALRERLAELSERRHDVLGVSLCARIGIHTGMVVVGTVGNDLKMDYTAIGDTTNLASRLQSLAKPGSILASEATMRLLPGRFHTRPVGPFQVKGKRDPILAHEVLKLAGEFTPMSVARVRGLTPLVGRSRELAQLEACSQLAREGLAQVAAVVGEAGSGKSRLLYEFRNRLEGQSLALFEARCSSILQAVPYAPWAGMVRTYLGLVPGEPVSDSTRKVREAVGDAGGRETWIVPCLLDLLSLPAPGIENIPADQLKRSSFDAVDWIVTKAGMQKPLLMIVEDLHWIDDASREMLEIAVGRFSAGRGMLLVTHRPRHRPTWDSSVAFTQLSLHPVCDADAALIVRHHAGGEVPAELERRILEKGEGNPFFLEELTRSLVEEGTLVAREGELTTMRPVDEIRIPDTVQELIGARLDRLPPAAKRTAQIASVIGRQFEKAQLEKLLLDDGIDVGAELEELEHLGVIHRKSGVEVGDEYRFGESLMQEVAYESLLLRERRQLHGRVGALHEEVCACEGGETLVHCAVIARHYARSDEPEKGIAMLLQTAEEAQRLPSYGDAARLFQESWELAESTLLASGNRDESLKRLTLRSALGVCAGAVLYGPENQHAEGAAVRAETLARELGEDDALANAMVLRGMVLVNSGSDRFNDGIVSIEQSLELARGCGLEHTAARVARGLAVAYMADGRFDDAQAVLEQVFADFERLGDRESLSDAYMGTRYIHGRLLMMRDDLAAAERYGLETLELARQVRNRTIESASLSTLGLIDFIRGDNQKALAWAKEALALALEIDNVGSIRSSQAIVLGVQAESRETAASNVELDRVDSAPGGDRTGDAPLIVEVLLASGALERAARVAQTWGVLAGGRYRSARAAIALGEVALNKGPGHWDEAEQHFADAFETAVALGARSTLGLARLASAKLKQARGEPDEAHRQARLAELSFREIGAGRYVKIAGQLGTA